MARCTFATDDIADAGQTGSVNNQSSHENSTTESGNTDRTCSSTVYDQPPSMLDQLQGSDTEMTNGQTLLHHNDFAYAPKNHGCSLPSNAAEESHNRNATPGVEGNNPERLGDLNVSDSASSARTSEDAFDGQTDDLVSTQRLQTDGTCRNHSANDAKTENVRGITRTRHSSDSGSSTMSENDESVGATSAEKGRGKEHVTNLTKSKRKRLRKKQKLQESRENSEKKVSGQAPQQKETCLPVVSKKPSVNVNNERHNQEIQKKMVEELRKENECLSLNCRVCMNDVIGVMFFPCSHSAVCPTCSQQLVECPICRGNIQSRMDVFMVF